MMYIIIIQSYYSIISRLSFQPWCFSAGSKRESCLSSLDSTGGGSTFVWVVTCALGAILSTYSETESQYEMLIKILFFLLFIFYLFFFLFFAVVCLCSQTHNLKTKIVRMVEISKSSIWKSSRAPAVKNKNALK